MMVNTCDWFYLQEENTVFQVNPFKNCFMVMVSEPNWGHGIIVLIAMCPSFTESKTKPGAEGIPGGQPHPDKYLQCCSS